ncbi:Cobalt-precorrin-2 C(20)-methyltransferase [Kluyvera intermedia]|nr:Cobalt-precorrin-2 C(20)-methyltransferase [Kluyvera intermedia]
MSGKLYALSTGPGAADLITVRAARILGSLDILYAPAGRKGGDSLALSIVREYLGEHTEVRCCHFPMSADSAEKEAVWDDVSGALVREVEAGKQVGLLLSGTRCCSAPGSFCSSASAARSGWKLFPV